MEEKRTMVTDRGKDRWKEQLDADSFHVATRVSFLVLLRPFLGLVLRPLLGLDLRPNICTGFTNPATGRAAWGFIAIFC
ncbi:hypothetical protein V6N13_095129 [Hibiscus sabdariffa]|uniref:Uncharacterized protein n=1 Tax=Hibiscus sabdariffa TaxID=183260 RepID=A0ABR2PSM0_9ROSI